MMMTRRYVFYFFFNDTATTEIYTLSLHDALPISIPRWLHERFAGLEDDQDTCRLLAASVAIEQVEALRRQDRKSTRLNSSHLVISYAVFCLKKKNTPPTLFSCSSWCQHSKRLSLF